MPRKLRMVPASLLLVLLALATVTWTIGLHNYTCNSSVSVRVNELQQETSTIGDVRDSDTIYRSAQPFDTGINRSDTVYKHMFRSNYPQEDSQLILNSSYFKPRSEVVVNPLMKNYIIEPRGVCKEQDGAPYVLMMIPSMVHHSRLRDTIRTTWGSVVHTPWPRTTNLPKVKIVFVFAKSKHEAEESILETESSLYGDVLYVDFVDSYRNLTYKSLTSLHWAATRCAEARFFMKVDEDTFVNVPYLLDFLHYHQAELKRTVVGYSISKPVSVRTGKWAVDSSAYPLPVFPRYMYGHSYVITGDVLQDLVNVSQHMPFIPVEDATVTGVLAHTVHATRLHNSMFAMVRKPFTCLVVKNTKLTVTMISEQAHHKIWEAVASGECTYDLLPVQ